MGHFLAKRHVHRPGHAIPLDALDEEPGELRLLG
jgi:hypothetical protein